MSSAAAYLKSPGIAQWPASSTTRPMISEPTSAPNAVPRPPSVTAANSSSRICRPVSHLMPLVDQGVEDAGQAGQTHRDRPDQPDHLVGVDAGGLGERRVVRHRPGRPADPGAQQDVADHREHHDRDAHRDERLVGHRDRTELVDRRVLDHDADGAGADEVLEGVLHRPARGRSSRSSAGSAPGPRRRSGCQSTAVLEPAR